MMVYFIQCTTIIFLFPLPQVADFYMQFASKEVPSALDQKDVSLHSVQAK